MIHLDRNHPSPPTQNKHQILPTNPISWPARDDDYVNPLKNSKGPMTPADQDNPLQDSAPSSPASPADGTSASPTRERSSSLSPAPSPRPPPADAQTAASTPLSELSPPPDDDDDDAAPTPAKQDSSSSSSQEQSSSNNNNRAKDAAASAPASPPSRGDDHDPKPSQQSSHLMPASSPVAPPVDSIATPSAAGTEPTSPAPGDPKVNVMLELNEELLKVCMEFQKRKMALSEAPFQAYSLRLQSNLAWSASVVDRDRQPGSPIPPLPMMDPPPPIDFYPTERIQELYMELPTVFAKDIARRASTSASPLKRERSDDNIPADVMNKRRDTGESKTMMPPPPMPIPSPVANAASPFANNSNSNLGGMTNGSGVGTPPGGDSLLGPQNPMMGDPQLSAASRERVRQAQMRAAQQQGQGNRQMSPPSSNNPNPGPAGGAFPPGGGGGGGGNNAIAGPSGAGGMPPGMPQHVQQMYAILTTPGHPFVQYMSRMMPNFDSLPIGAKLQNMLKAHTQIQRERQQNGQGGGGGPFPGGGQTSPVSPMSGGGGGGGPNPNPMFVGNNNAGMDLRAMNSTPLPGGGGGGGGMNMGGMNGITPQQRQLMLMQQQQRGGGGGGGGPGNMNMSPQQQMMLQHQQQEQQRMRMEQQQRMGMAAQQGGSPTHPGSPMMGGDFPALRSNASIPGIARIARSPSDGGGAGGMTPRMTPTRGPSMGADDFQRAMMQQRGGMAGPGGGGFGPGGFPQQPSQGWNQNTLQQQAMMGGGGGGGGGYGMGMGMGGGGGQRPGSAYGGAPSPPGSGGGGMGGGQNWGQGPGPGAYFAGSPGGGDLGMQRHMSGTPAPQMQQNSSPDADFDAFNWG
ncbi:hypothetical protein C8F04DRAFT_1172291 [Mycena alexandri]|uniref:Uncharacterized protein n=1 Tax=Mycena alexandri TaxID=1745969 RepID=A0AAD6XF77_9AGAR|nr:hypothetical protein C8F04DRAFT_1172291 [Mycena alexandri]